MKSFIFLSVLSFCFIQLNAQDPAAIVKKLDDEKVKYFQMAETIWKWAEPGYLESKTTALLQENLKKEGFSIETGIADIPTAFVASYGSGKPVIGILAEMDALPGLSQQPTPERKALEENGYGHGCGHNLFGAGSLAAAVAVKNWMEANNFGGSLRIWVTNVW